MYGLNVKLQVFSSQSASHAIHRWTFVVVYLQDKELNEKCTIHNTYIYTPATMTNRTSAAMLLSLLSHPLWQNRLCQCWAVGLVSSRALEPLQLQISGFFMPYRPIGHTTNVYTMPWHGGTTLHLSQKFAKPSISHPAGIFIMMPNKFRIQTTRSRSL